MAIVSGPIFHPERQVAEMLRSIEHDLAQEAFRLVHSNLVTSLRHPTGYYQSRIRITQEPSHTSVNDSSVVYGPWLEGVGSRNRTTRFKGYFSFRRASQQLDLNAVLIAMPSVERFIRAMN
jgi:hypothetical protein